MIRELLSTDVEFAKGLLARSHSDKEILDSLAARSIEPAAAAKLVDDLRHGREPNFHVQPPLPSNVQRNTPKPKAVLETTPTLRPPARHRRPRPRGGAWWVVLLAIVFLWALWYAWFRAGADASRDLIDLEKHRIPDAPTKDAAR